MSVNRALFSSKEQAWGTPDDYFDELNKLCRFTTDACAFEANSKLPHFIPPNGDGLNYSWNGLCVFDNPEYRFCNLWMPKARNESLNGRCFSANLVPYRPDPEWWSIGALSEDGEAGALLASCYDPKHRVMWLRWRHLITGIHSVPNRLPFKNPKALKPGDRAGANAPFPSAVVFHISPSWRTVRRTGLLERCPR